MKPKKYSNHTGKVNYMDINCEVESATFELLKETKLFKNKIEIVAIFHSGTITGGRLKNIIVNDGLIKDSMATGAIFYGGTFSGSTLGFSIWYYEQHNPPKEWEFIR